MCGALAVLGTAACGDDDGDGANADAGTGIDAGDPDAMPPTEFLRSGTVAVTETNITNPSAAAVGGLSGAVVVVSFADETTRTVAPVTGFESAVGGCAITIYDVGTDEPPDPVGEGVVAMADSPNGPFACGFVDAEIGYVCQSTTAAVAGGAALDAVVVGDGEGGATFVIDGVAFPDTVRGMYMRLSGFPAASVAGEVDGDYPIVAVETVGDTTTLTLALAAFAGTSTGDADAIYASFVGAAPIPGGFDFLDDGTADVTISKTAGPVVAAVDVDLKASGEGFTLIDDAGNDFYLPHAIPTDGSVVKFGCEGDGCGADGAGLLSAITVNGVTTDATLPGAELDPLGIEMPDATGQYATFTCSALGVDEITLTAAAMDAIMSTSPTRIQISVGRMRGEIVTADDESYQTFVLTGHSHLGYVTVE